MPQRIKVNENLSPNNIFSAEDKDVKISAVKSLLLSLNTSFERQALYLGATKVSYNYFGGVENGSLSSISYFDDNGIEIGYLVPEMAGIVNTLTLTYRLHPTAFERANKIVS
jgi:hypothetical protein